MTNSTENTHNNLLDEVIAKARLKGAKISGWTLSPNKKVIIHIPEKLPIYYLSADAAVDSLIHQYKLVSEYRYLYQNSAKNTQMLLSDTSHNDQKNFLATQAMYECDAIIQNMDHELTGSTKRKLDETMDKIISSQNLNHTEFYELQNTLLEHYRAKSKESTSSQKKKQIQLFIRFLEDISHSDI